jgi:hypothetical protein
VLALSAVALTTAVACGGTSSAGATPTVPPPRASASTAQLTTAVPASPSTAAANASATPKTGPAGATRKVSANTASRAEVQAALEAAGVPSAANWTREVLEYRPYPTTDPNFAKLRGELAKYNPAPGVVDQIIAVLEP